MANLKASDFEELKLDDFEPMQNDQGGDLNANDFEALSESDFEPMQQEKGFVDKVVSLFSIPEAAQRNQDIRDAQRERVGQMAGRGAIREEDRKVLFGNGQAYENPDAPDWNIGKGVVNRTNELTGNMAQGFGQLVDAATRYATGNGSETKKLTNAINNYVYENNKMDYVPTHTWDELKTAFKKGGVFDIDSWQEVGNYIAEQGVLSIPDMGEMVAMLPGYVISRTQEIAETRTEEDGRKGQEPTGKDYAIAAPAAAASIFLDRLGLKATTTDVFKQIGEDILTKSPKELMKATLEKVGEGTLKEAGTEFIQEGVIESTGERVGTLGGQPIIDIDRGIGAAVAGGGAGGVVGGTTAIGANAYNATSYGKARNLENAAAMIMDAHDLAPADNRPQLFSSLQGNMAAPGEVIKPQIVASPPEEKRTIIEATKDTIADITPEEAANVIEDVKNLAADATPEEVQQAAEVVQEIMQELTPQEEAELAQLLDIPESELTIDDEWRIEDLQAKLNGEQSPGEIKAEEFEPVEEAETQKPEDTREDVQTQKPEIELSQPAEPKAPEVPRRERINAIKNNPRLPELVENIKAAKAYEENRPKKPGIEAFKAQLQKEGLHPSDDEYKARMVKHMNTRREAIPYDVFSNYSAAEIIALEKGKLSSAMLEKVEESMAELENNPEFNQEPAAPQLNTIQRLRQKRDAEAAFGELETKPTSSIKPVLRPEAEPLPGYNETNIENARMLKYRREKQRKAKEAQQPKESIFKHPEQGRPIKDDEEYKRTQDRVLELVKIREKTTKESVRKGLSKSILWHRSRLRDYTGTPEPVVTEDNIDRYHPDEQTVLREEGKVGPSDTIPANKETTKTNEVAQTPKEDIINDRENTTSINENGSEELIRSGTEAITEDGTAWTEEAGTNQEAGEEVKLIGEPREDDRASAGNSWEKQHYINGEPYSVENINHEYPNVVIAKLIKQDLGKLAKELAELSGLNPAQGKPFGGVYVNLPPAGGEASFTLWDNEYKYGARFDFRIEPDYNDNGYDLYQIGYTIPIELVNNENKKIRGIGYMYSRVGRYDPDKQPYSTKDIAAEIKDYVSRAQAQVDHAARLDAEIKELQDKGKPKHKPFGELDLDNIEVAKAVSGMPDLVVQNQVGQWVELPSPAWQKYGKYGRITGNYDNNYFTIEVEVSKHPGGGKFAHVPTYTTSRVATINLATEKKIKNFLKGLGYEIELKNTEDAAPKKPVSPSLFDFEESATIEEDKPFVANHIPGIKEFIAGNVGKKFLYNAFAKKENNPILEVAPMDRQQFPDQVLMIDDEGRRAAYVGLNDLRKLEDTPNEPNPGDPGTNTVRADDRNAVPDNGSKPGENTGKPDDRGNESDTTREPDTAGNGGSERGNRKQSLELVEDDNTFILEQQAAVASGEISRYNDNIAAIRLLKENKPRYTLEEKKVLSRYTGWGGLQKAFQKPNGEYHNGWEDRARKLLNELSEDEHKQAKSGVLDAYYTPVETVKAMWSIAEHLGFNGGMVLEPSMGTGRFFGLLPDKFKANTAFNGVELDPTTYKIATALYKVNGRNKGFQETEYKDEHELVIGNPPYAKQIKVVDKNNKGLSGLTIHDYFVAKSLDAVKDGGIVTFVITSSFMDSMTQRAKHEISSRAKLVGAMRLPNTAFSSAGTSVTTDIIILQKLHPGEKENLTNDELYGWLEPQELNGAKISSYYVNNPKMLLGEWRKGYRGGELVSTPEPLQLQIAQAMENLPKNIMNQADKVKKQADVSGADTQMPPSVIYEKNGEYFVNIKTGESLEPQAITGKKDRIKDFIQIRDLTNSVIDMQLDSKVSDDVVEAERAKLNKAYDSFFKKHGYLNNSTNRSIIVQDKSGYTVLGLEEKYQRPVSAKQAATWGVPVQKESGEKADILTKRTIRPDADVKTQDSNEALLLSTYRKGGVDLDYMTDITGKSKETLIKELKGKIFKDDRVGYVTRDVFLSGDVKTKLEYTVDEYARAELKKVIPADKEAHEITADIGASWISVDLHKQYMKERLGFRSPDLGYNRTTSKWSVPRNNYSSDFPFSAAAEDTNILESALNNKKIVIRRQEKVGGITKSYVDEEATTLVNSRVDELKEDFKNWVFASEKRRNELVPLYNDLYNRYNKIDVEQKIDEYEIPNLKFFKPRQHQTKAVYKAVFGNNPLLLNHTVGSGKTLTSQMIAMEWRRLGKANKPLIVALKSTVEQYTREFKEAYPNAKVLLPNDSDFSKANRKRFLSSIATGDYDAIVLSHEQLMKLENPYELQKQLIEDEIAAAEEAIVEAKAENDRFTVRDLETAIEKLEARYEKLTDTSKDSDILSFEKLGIDGMIVDESHQFKKLAYSTSMGSIKGMPSTDGSLRAFDLYVKTKAILKKNNNLVFMTGTPVTNTLPELFLIQKYLQEDILQDQGLGQFDAWAKNYADPTTDIEMTPTGGFKEVTRMKSFKNIDTLMETAGQIIDTVTNEDIKKSDPNFHLPKLNGGKPQTIFIEPSQAQLDFTKTLIDRLATVNNKDNPDNHLAIFGDAVKMSMDMRLLGNYADEKNSKVNSVVSHAMDKYREFSDKKGTQLIFSDIGTPKGGGKAKAELEELMAKADKGDTDAQKALIKNYSDAEIEDILYGGTFSIYEDIRSKLIAQGVPASEIAFIHDYDSKAKKDELSKKVNSGEIRFVLGSTKKLGTGMNVQKRLTAVHHIDIPYTPAELEQRNGRIIRQGNLLLKEDPNFKADIFYYATKQTLDGVKWQILENKSKFIQDFMSGVSSDVDIEEESNSELAERMKAEASGNPYLIDKIKADKQVKKLEALKRGFETNQAVMQQKKQVFEYEVNTLPEIIAGYAKDIKEIESNPVKVEGRTYEKPADMGKAIYKRLDKYVQAKGLRPAEVGTVGNIKIMISHDQDTGKSTITFDGAVKRSIEIEFFKQQPEGIGTRINNELARYAEGEKKAKADLEDAKESIAGIDKKLEEKFNKWDEYKAAKAAQQEAIANIENAAKDPGQQKQEEPQMNFFDYVDDNGLTQREEQFVGPLVTRLREESKVIDEFLGNKIITSLFKLGESYSYLPGSHKVVIGKTKNVSQRDIIIAVEHEIAHFKTMGFLAENPNDKRVAYINSTIEYMKRNQDAILSKLEGNSRSRIEYILTRKDGIRRTAEAIAVLGAEKSVARDLFVILGKEKPRLSDILANLIRAIKRYVVGDKTVAALKKNEISAAQLAAAIKEVITEGHKFNEEKPYTALEARGKLIGDLNKEGTAKEKSRFEFGEDMRPGFVHLGDIANLPFALSELINKGKNALDRVLEKYVTGKVKDTKFDTFMRRYIGTSQAGLGLLTRKQEIDFVKHFRVLQARLSKADISAEDKAKLIEDAQGDIHDDLFNMMSIDYLENPEVREEIAIDFPELAEQLDQVRDYINRLSEEAMQRGIILPSQHAKWKDRYLSRLYMATFKPEVAAKVQRGIKEYENKSGRKIDSIVQYLLENPNEQERLGAVLDVDLMIKQTIAKTQGNIGIDEFFRGITERTHIADTDALVALSDRVNNLPMMFSPYYATEVAIPYIQDMIKRLDEDIDFEEIYFLEERIGEIQDQLSAALDEAEYQRLDKDKAQIPKDKRYGSIAGLMLPRDVASLVKSQFVAGLDPETIVEQTDSLGRKFLAYFKWAKVPANIFSYPRNLQSNFWQWSMSGADPVHFFKEYPLAIKSMITKDGWYQKARENGILNTNSISAEVNDSLRIIADEMAADRVKSKKLIKAMQVVGDAYGLVDDIAKIARMKYAIEQEGMSVIDAVSKAQDTHYDYSLTYDLIRGMRDPDMTRGSILKLIGTLFPTYTQKTIAFLYDTIIERPATLMLIAAGLTALIRGGEEEDKKEIGAAKYEEILKTLPEWTKNNPLIKVSMKHKSDGSIEVVLTDISYVVPFGSILAAASSAVHGDIPGAAGNLGVGGSPFQIMANLKNNLDAFTGREIYYKHYAPQALWDGTKYLANQLAPGTITKIISLMDTKHPVPIRLIGINSYVYDSRELAKYNEYAAKEALMDAGKRAVKFKRRIFQADKDYSEGKITREEHQEIVTKNEEEVAYWKERGEKDYNEKSIESGAHKDYNSISKKVKTAVKEFRDAKKMAEKETGTKEPLQRFKQDKEKVELVRKYEIVKLVEREVNKLKKVKEALIGKKMPGEERVKKLKIIDDKINSLYERGYNKMK